MRDIKPPEAILAALLFKAIDLQAAEKYYSNYLHFEKERASIENAMVGQWVAALNGRLVAEASIERLEAAIAKQPNADRAYIEHVGRAV